MANTIEVKVPDIGNFKGVPVIEILVKVGDTVAKDQGLVTLESDKATMEVPSSAAGVVKEIRVTLNQEVAEGAVVAVIETSAVLPPPGEGGAAAPDEGRTLPRLNDIANLQRSSLIRPCGAPSPGGRRESRASR